MKPRAPWLLRASVLAILAFLFLPILIIMAYAFAASNVQSWPIGAFSLRWFHAAWIDDEIRAAFILSLQVASLATLIATVLGTLAAMSVNRMQSGARDAVSFALVLPIALPGILTGMALNAYFTVAQMPLDFATIVIGHATFCIVIVYNNVLARLRRLPRSLTEASADLGASAFTTFTAGVQTTLPLWILGAIRLGQHLPEVNVVVFAVIVLTVIPVMVAQRLTGEAGTLHK